MLRLLITLSGLFSSALAVQPMNMTPGVTPISNAIYDLHMWAFWTMVVIGVIVFGLMFFSLWRYRKSTGAVAHKFHANLKLEMVLLVIPMLILIALAVPATKVLMQMEDSSESTVTIKITAYQWRWSYDYLDQGVSFFSDLSTPQEQIENLAPKGKNYLLEVDHPLVVPVNEKIRFLITSNDVIHTWWVPALGVKKDAVPGFIHESWAKIDKPGTYRGQCAELCGAGHGFMPIVVEAVSKQDFDKWVASQKQEKK